MEYLNILLVLACLSLVRAEEVDDGEQKKRGAGKPVALNAIPTAAQKPDYTYLYQNPSHHYQQQNIPNSFYPTPSATQYYQPGGLSQDQTNTYPGQPQLNLIPPSTSQFVPLNFVPNPGYQSKYQLVPTKTASGNIQLTLIPPSVLQSPPVVYPQSLFSHAPAPQPQLQQPAGYGQGYQHVIGNPYVNQPQMLLIQPNSFPSLGYQGAAPANLYNYYQQPPQVKYNLVYGGGQAGAQGAAAEYDKLPQSQPKEENEIVVQGSDYLSPAESSQSYKNTYASNRSTHNNSYQN